MNMSMSSIIRAAVGGSRTKTRAEGEKPDDKIEDEIDEKDALEDEQIVEDEMTEEDDEALEEEEKPVAEDDKETDKMSAVERKAFKAGKTKGLAAGAKQMQTRMAAIMGSPAADANPALAAHLAFYTNQTASAAIGTLKAGGVAAGRLAGKMAGQPKLGGGGNSKEPDTQTMRSTARQNYINTQVLRKTA